MVWKGLKELKMAISNRLTDYFIQHEVTSGDNIISEIEKNVNTILRVEYSNKQFNKNDFMLLLNNQYEYCDNIEVARKLVYQASYDSRYEKLFDELNLNFRSIDNDDSFVQNIANSIISYIVTQLAENFEKYYKNVFII